MKKKNNLPRRETGGELIIDPKIRPEPNEYLLDISRKIKLLKVLVIFVTVVFAVVMVFFFRNDITLENYRYLIRFLSTSDEYSGDYRTIYFDSASTTSIGIFNGDLVTVSVNDVNLYSMKGNNTLTSPVAFGTPVLKTDGKYMLVYDLGGCSFQLYNNFSVLGGETFDYPISTATVSKEGMYAVVTKSLDYQSVINLYDHNFQLLSKIYKDKYVMDVEIKDDASQFMVISVFSSGGTYSSEIMKGKPYQDEPESEIVLSGEFAMMGGYFDNGNSCVLSKTALHFYNDNNEEISSFPLGNIIPTKCIFFEDYAVIAYNKNIVGSDTEIVILSSKGEELSRYDVSGRINDIVNYKNDIYVLSGKSLIKLSSHGGETRSYDINGGGSSLFLCDSDTLIVGYSNLIEAHSISQIFTDDKGE